jgi:glycine cleavage system T protein (aminomethyltransferase)
VSLVRDKVCVEPSPFHDRAAELCRTNAWRRAGRLTLVEVYSAVEEEYWALKAGAGLCDLSGLRCYQILGPEALAGLNHLLARHVAPLKPGHEMDVLWCSDAGAVIGHGTLRRESEDRFVLVTREPCRSWLEDTLAGFDCTLAELTQDVARLGLAGPAARFVLDAMGLTLARQLEPKQFVAGALRGFEIGVARVGAEQFELWTGADEARVLWDRLMTAGKPFGLKPAGLAAQNLLRLERGEPAQGIDFVGALAARLPAEMVRPEALGFEALIDRGKTGYVGQTALARPAPAGRRLVRVIAQTAEPLAGAILAGPDQRAAGYLTASGHIPALGASLAFAWLDRDPKGALGLVLAPDAGSAGQLRLVPCRIG